MSTYIVPTSDRSKRSEHAEILLRIRKKPKTDGKEGDTKDEKDKPEGSFRMYKSSLLVHKSAINLILSVLL